MQSMRCLAIGISDAPPLEFLQGAANGARFFGAWARAQNIQTEILTDEETPVGFTEVADAFRRLFAGAPKVSRFLLYFAGHGLARDAAEDLWLLSKWRAEQRAIAVGALRRRLERYGIEQITLIGDACRSLPASAETADLTADAVLGMGRFDPTAPRLDMLLASSSFHAAYMVPGAQPEDDRCIFSGVLEEALSGAREDAFDSRRNSITSVSLAKFLEREVPVRAAQYKVELQPSLATGFWEPDDVYVEVKPATPPQPKPWPSAAAVDAMSAEATASGNRSRGWSTRGGSRVLSFDEASDIGSLPGFATRGAGLRGGSTSSRGALLAQDRVREATTAQARNQQIQQFVAAYRDEQERRPLPDIATGVRLIGDRARSVELGSSGTAADEADGRWWRVVSATTRGTRARPDVTGPLLLELESGRWAAAAVLPGFVATFTLAKEGVVSLIYRRPYDHADARQTELAVSRMRAGALIGEAALDLAAELRTAKERDPVRGLLAAYLYDGQGDTDSVRRTAYYLAEAGLALPFDIAILGRLKIRKNRGRYVATVPEVSERRPLSKVEARKPWTFHATRETDALIAGVVPWLRQGWAMLEDEPIPSFPPGLLELRNELLRSPFTTLTNEGGLRLQSILKEM